LALELTDLERVAAGSWLIVDLETFSMLLNRAASACGRTGSAAAARTKTITYSAEHEIMSARVAYADVPTRGFALEDVIPYASLAGEAVFRTRVLLASKGWKRYAADTDFATLLASETPWEAKCGDVLSAARPIDHGKLIVTDLPWLVAGQHGRLLAPHLAEHLLRMHLAGPVADSLQYWNRWDDCRVIVRDMGDMPRWYPPLRAVRWVSERPGIARLGVTLPSTTGRGCCRHLMICTGRIDQRSSHDGVPPEPMTIFMKCLVREVRERTRWAARFLRDTAGEDADSAKGRPGARDSGGAPDRRFVAGFDVARGCRRFWRPLAELSGPLDGALAQVDRAGRPLAPRALSRRPQCATGRRLLPARADATKRRYHARDGERGLLAGRRRAKARLL